MRSALAPPTWNGLAGRLAQITSQSVRFNRQEAGRHAPPDRSRRIPAPGRNSGDPTRVPHSGRSAATRRRRLDAGYRRPKLAYWVTAWDCRSGNSEGVPESGRCAVVSRGRLRSVALQKLPLGQQAVPDPEPTFVPGISTAAVPWMVAPTTTAGRCPLPAVLSMPPSRRAVTAKRVNLPQKRLGLGAAFGR